MMRIAVAILALLIPTTCMAYTVTTGARAIGDQTSRFEPVDIGQSTFTERPQRSSFTGKSQSSGFGLTNMNSTLRQKTERTLSGFGARRDGELIIVDLPSDVLFDFDKHDIRADARAVLTRLAGVLKAMPDKPVLVIGHTDSKGADDYNQNLSQRRAESVVTCLARNGVRSAMTPEGKGENNPIAPNEKADGSDDPVGRQKNRRVEFVIGKKP